jgi:hypothetical protein
MKQLGNLLKRTIGVIMFAAIPGMATGAAAGIGPVMGALTGVLTVFSSIIIYFGVQLAWDASISDEDIEKGFRAAVAKQAGNNEEVKEALGTSASEAPDLSDFGDVDELDALDDEEEDKPVV